MVRVAYVICPHWVAGCRNSYRGAAGVGCRAGLVEPAARPL